MDVSRPLQNRPSDLCTLGDLFDPKLLVPNLAPPNSKLRTNHYPGNTLKVGNLSRLFPRYHRKACDLVPRSALSESFSTPTPSAGVGATSRKLNRNPLAPNPKSETLDPKP